MRRTLEHYPSLERDVVRARLRAPAAAHRGEPRLSRRAAARPAARVPHGRQRGRDVRRLAAARARRLRDRGRSRRHVLDAAAAGRSRPSAARSAARSPRWHERPARPRRRERRADRGAGTPGRRPALANDYLAPRDATEAGLARIWEAVLGVAPIGVDDDFFDLGGDSLRAFALDGGRRADLRRVAQAARPVRRADGRRDGRADRATRPRGLIATDAGGAGVHRAALLHCGKIDSP